MKRKTCLRTKLMPEVHRQRTEGGLKGSHQAQDKELLLMNALCFNVMSTTKTMINDLGDEVEKDKDVYWTISGI